jgi:hypothetical protein
MDAVPPTATPVDPPRIPLDRLAADPDSAPRVARAIARISGGRTPARGPVAFSSSI